ncbi:MAG: zinc-ribbon domain-containing protein [Nitrosomonadales bacterium]|nr:zinc-ribbon domain-containing protein [Nitrosomonadales bacterium]
MPVGNETLTIMDGTTLCPHCDTRFKIAETQLEAHRGMVRCGHCLQAFDARPGFIPDQPSPQLELPILNEPAPPPKLADKPAVAPAALEEAAASSIATAPDADAFAHEAINMDEVASNEGELDAARYGTLDYVEMATAARNEMPPDVPLPPETESSQPMTLAEQVAIVQDEDDSEYRPERRTWPWAIAALLLLLVLIAQAAYFFRVDLAARLPVLKPALVSYCQLLKCTVPLPQNTDLMSIESSNLEADPAHENQIVLNVLLRNRASYAQAFPNLELTLNDTQDNALARRVFRPADYLPPLESETLGLLPQHEISVRLYLETADLRPTGYRLALLYPKP